MKRGGHLKLLPKPLVKCNDAPEPRAYPPTKGVTLRKAPIEGRWWIERTERGRTDAISVTTAELEKLVHDGRRALASEGK